MAKKFILNADDFGLSKAHNKAVLIGYNNGFLTSASVCVNGKAFNSAVNEILPECPNLGIGLHLNLTKGKSLTKSKFLVDKKNRFKLSFLQLWFKSNDKEFLKDVEKEFRAQIEMILRYSKIDHIDSKAHIHSIPNIFKIVLKLAEEYKVPFVRTHFEEIYVTPNVMKHLNLKFLHNIAKVWLMNKFSRENKHYMANSSVMTNDYLIGVEFAGMMDSSTTESGLAAIENDCMAEVVIYPCLYANNKKNQNYKEFAITQNKTLKDSISRLGFDITNYKKISE